MRISIRRECQKLFEKMRKLSTIFFKFLASAGLTRQVNDTCVSFQKFIPQKNAPDVTLLYLLTFKECLFFV